jgi:type IV pilus assembly protein PilE
MRRLAGFTIIELMIVVVIIGLLAGVALPGYREQVNKGKRAEGKAALTAAASRLERFYSQYNCYPSAATNCGTAPDSATVLTVAGINGFSGDNATSAAYNISITATPQAFTVTATPRAPWRDTKCGNLTLSNTGRKWTQSNGATDDPGAPVSGCW